MAFYCTFLALRAQDRARDVKDIRDYEMMEETELFGGCVTVFETRVLDIWRSIADMNRQIDDDGYLHALRVYQDVPSGAIRIQSSVHNGPKHRYSNPNLYHPASH